MPTSREPNRNRPDDGDTQDQPGSGGTDAAAYFAAVAEQFTDVSTAR